MLEGGAWSHSFAWWVNWSERAAHLHSTTVLQTVWTHTYCESAPVLNSCEGLLTVMSPRAPLRSTERPRAPYWWLSSAAELHRVSNYVGEESGCSDRFCFCLQQSRHLIGEYRREDFGLWKNHRGKRKVVMYFLFQSLVFLLRADMQLRYRIKSPPDFPEIPIKLQNGFGTGVEVLQCGEMMDRAPVPALPQHSRLSNIHRKLKRLLQTCIMWT